MAGSSLNLRRTTFSTAAKKMLILPEYAICSWTRVPEEASSYKNALAVEATSIIEARNRLGNEKFQFWASREAIVRQYPKKGVRRDWGWGSDSR